VLLELVRMYPNSTIATLVHIPGSTHPELDARVTSTSFLQRMPGGQKGYRNYLPLFPRAVRSVALDPAADLYFSVSHAVAKGVRVPAGKPHLCYCNTPMRYIWGMEDHYLSKLSPKRLALAAVKPYLRRFDLRNAQVTKFLANSRNVAERILRIYGLPSTVVYPGIDETFYTPGDATTVGGKRERKRYLVVSALVGYKRVDLAIAAVRETPERELVVIGGGPDEAKLRAMAGSAPNIRFLGRAPDEAVREEYRSASAFLFPGEEDFGLTPVEAQACGTPVIAYRAGGVLETVVEGAEPTGVFFNAQTPEALRAAMDQFEARQHLFSQTAARQNALRFTWTQFRSAIHAIVRETLSASPSSGPTQGSRMQTDS
jgi:glycosyltransferase involved in cell wall biosynthesis